MSSGVALLSVRELRTYFAMDGEIIRAVDGASFDVHAGKTTALIGESGSGKSVSAMSILGLVDGSPGIVGGEIMFKGRNVLDGLSDVCTIGRTGERLMVRKDVSVWRRRHRQQVAALRGKAIGCIFQDPVASLSPFLTVGAQIREAMTGAGITGSRDALDHMALDWLARMRIADPASVLHAYPSQLSGGMAQRVMIVIAIAGKPSLVIADEPTTALDVSVQREVLGLLKGLQSEFGIGMLLITHDISVAAHVAETIAVMYAGRIVEYGPRDAVLRRSRNHPYTRALLGTVDRGTSGGDVRTFIRGDVPDPATQVDGCSFHPRCTAKELLADRGTRCMQEEPPDRTVHEHRMRCWEMEYGTPPGEEE